ncbi:hypothetical protein CHU98_g12058 [Xylaria longipes]|nr:hypothetical protein CHU98_g12058 [Xylaria longipes]
MTNFVINITSDPVCPWCYIGKRRLDKAIALYQKVYPSGRHDTFTVNWTAYYLDATAPAKGISHNERLLQKLATTRSKFNPDLSATDEETKELAQQLTARLASIGRQEGIAFELPRQDRQHAVSPSRPAPKTASSRRSSRHTSRATPTSPATTPSPTWQRAWGLIGAAMLAWLDGGDGGEEVDQEDRSARARGVQGVPCFMVQNAKVDGAQDVQDFMELFVKIKEEEQEQEQRQV